MAHIVVVEDSASVRRLVTLILEGAGHRVTTAESGAGLRQTTPPAELLITDLTLPGGDGVELATRVIREWQPAPRVLFMSGQVDRPLPFGLITKPFSAERLCAQVQEALL